MAVVGLAGEADHKRATPGRSCAMSRNTNPGPPTSAQSAPGITLQIRERSRATGSVGFHAH